MRGLIWSIALVAIACTPAAERPDSSPDYLYVWAWATDTTRGSALVVFDLDQETPAGNRLVRVLPADMPSVGAHHIEHQLAPDSLLFASAFGSGRTFLFDLRAPGDPRIRASVGDAGPFSHPHSYARLPNGNRLATFQWKVGGGLPGGLVELDTAGHAVRWSSAATGAADSLQIVPYSLVLLPQIDRVVSTSTHMIEDIGIHVQIWRLADLTLLHTIAVPLAAADHPHAGHDAEHHKLPGEPRVLADGRTVMFGTFTCGLYHITGLDGQAPQVAFSAAFPGANCAVPVVIGKYWIQTVPAINALVALDVTDPAHPVEVSRLVFGADVTPHWLGADASGRRLVTTSADKDDPTVRLVDFDPTTGVLAARADSLVLSLRGIRWPDGYRGDAIPHGVIFSRR